MKHCLIKILTLGAVGVAVVLTGCSTVSGIGQDITKSAEWSKSKMGSSW